MLILEENFRRHLEAFASELFIFSGYGNLQLTSDKLYCSIDILLSLKFLISSTECALG